MSPDLMEDLSKQLRRNFSKKVEGGTKKKKNSLLRVMKQKKKNINIIKLKNTKLSKIVRLSGIVCPHKAPSLTCLGI